MFSLPASFCWLVLCLTQATSIEFSDITRDVFPNGQYLGVMAAFGDFNSDKLTDVFCIQQGGKTLEVIFSNETQPYLGQTTLNCTFRNVITGVIPADFDGDAMMDVLVTLRDDGSSTISVVVLWGARDRIDCKSDVHLNLSSQPFIVDYNDDMVPDIMGEDEGKNRCVWLSNKRNFTRVVVSNAGELERLKEPHSCSVVDLNGDLVSDLVITGEKVIELWLKTGENFTLHQNVSYPARAVVIGQSSFVDFNTNSVLDHFIPVCFDRKCRSSELFVWQNEWVSVLKNFTYENDEWGFASNFELTLLETAALPITLRPGDFNMDGYPDFITVLENKNHPGKTKVVMLENVPCSDCHLGRTVKINWVLKGLDKISNIRLAVFFDLFENGVMDVLAASKVKSEWKIHVLKNIDSYDAYFIKVLVLSGLCFDDCPGDTIPYGTNQPGPMIMYNTTKFNGEPLSSCAVQMPQSAYFSLNLPYSVFGLGHTPNFVDHLTVALPAMKKKTSHKHEWSQIIPNSQMVVIPYPPEEESRWVNKLFLTPSHLVLLTCIALIGTCTFIAVLIGILHWRERKEDKREKMQDAYRFHFDAM